jgi:hypothetical protein
VNRDTRVAHDLGGEVEMMIMFLDYLRESILSKLDGLDEEAARLALVGSGTNLLGLIQHLTMAEAKWFGEVFAGSDDPLPTRSMQVDRLTTVTSARRRVVTNMSRGPVATRPRRRLVRGGTTRSTSDGYSFT